MFVSVRHTCRRRARLIPSEIPASRDYRETGEYAARVKPVICYRECGSGVMEEAKGDGLFVSRGYREHTSRHNVAVRRIVYVRLLINAERARRQ